MTREALPAPGDPAAVRAAYDAAPMPLAQLSWPDLRVVAANRAFHRWVGRDELVDRDARGLFPGLEDQQLLEAVDLVGRTGERLDTYGWRVPLRLPSDTGDPGELGHGHGYDLALEPVPDADGRVVGVRLAVDDRTVRALLAQAQREREPAAPVIRTVQEALLPPGLPVLPRVDLAAAYQLAEGDLHAGGDWYDAVVAPGGRVGLVVGDVVGHGVQAASVMGLLRAVLSASLAEGCGAVEALTRLDAYAASVRPARSATVVVVLLDPATGVLEYCTAGHPPPLVVEPGAEPAGRFLEPTGSGPLRSGRPFVAGTDHLAPGGVLALYTDGLLEHPERHPGTATVELLRAAREVRPTSGAGFRGAYTGPAPAQQVCARMVEAGSRHGGPDDLAVLAAQRLRQPFPGARTVADAVPTSLGTVRRDVSRWCDALHLAAPDRIGLLHTIGELVENTLRHAYPPDAPGRVRVALDLGDDGVITGSVTDGGTWVPPRTGPGPAGRGLPLARRLVDDLDVDGGPDGTRVRFRVAPLRAPTHLEAVWGPSTPYDVLEVELRDGAVRVSGPVDLLHAPRLRMALEAAVARDEPLVVDLGGVSYLGSSGIQALHDAGPERLRLVAPPGSVAQHVLELAAMPYDVSLDEPAS